jgi:hypothetical protein
MRNIVKGEGAESESRKDREYVVEEDDYDEEEETTGRIRTLES